MDGSISLNREPSDSCRGESLTVVERATRIVWDGLLCYPESKSKLGQDAPVQ